MTTDNPTTDEALANEAGTHWVMTLKSGDAEPVYGHARIIDEASEADVTSAIDRMAWLILREIRQRASSVAP